MGLTIAKRISKEINHWQKRQTICLHSINRLWCLMPFGKRKIFVLISGFHFGNLKRTHKRTMTHANAHAVSRKSTRRDEEMNACDSFQTDGGHQMNTINLSFVPSIRFNYVTWSNFKYVHFQMNIIHGSPHCHRCSKPSASDAIVPDKGGSLYESVESHFEIFY